jgi:hypothetical protein
VPSLAGDGGVVVASSQWAGANEPVFLGRTGQRMTRFGIHRLVTRHAELASKSMPSLVTKRVSSHTIRHTTAVHLLRAGVDINTIRAWLGHVSLDTTHVYAEVDMEMKAKALASVDISDQLRSPQHRGSLPSDVLEGAVNCPCRHLCAPNGPGRLVDPGPLPAPQHKYRRNISRIGVGLHDAGVGGELLLGMLALAIGRVIEHGAAGAAVPAKGDHREHGSINAP